MAGQEITVGLRFTADTAAARQQLSVLKQDLNNLSNLSGLNFGGELSNSLLQASNAAAQLKVQLQAATNVKTGGLDLTKFTYSLKQSGMSLEKYKQQLLALGPQGQQAFLQLASSIQQAEVPLFRINTLFSGLWDTLKRTARWQLSSSAIHAVIGSIQTAYHYAQDLNKSLNNIRIVTGQSVEQMSKFAKEANKAAKALGTTTTAYTDASLIYYQQGLSDKEVQERAEVTMKMANVTRQGAETVSDQMTAVWNNFAKGDERLESFADKMTALGAATASSTDEIATGLEKFAGVANTIGLSFDYAAAALTTITATTRQSAETVGTSLKTLFSRLEGLKLGETLEDGTDLNKYSEALAVAGVNIKDANGELKNMDTILDETMDKWQTLTKDQKVALAQTVGGIRQYNSFMTLMENSDFFKKNLNTEATSEGKLQEQQDIYAESWQAASDKVKAAQEGLYNSLLNDKFFIDLNNHFAKFVEFVDKLVKSMGGLKGILPTIATLILSIGGDKIAANFDRMAFGLKSIVTNGAEQKNLQSWATNELVNGPITEEMERMTVQYYSNVGKAQGELIKRASKMSDEEIQINQQIMERIKLINQENVNRAKEAEIATNVLQKDQTSLRVLQAQQEAKVSNVLKEGITENNYQKIANSFGIDISEFDTVEQKIEAVKNKLLEFQDAIRQNGPTFKEQVQEMQASAAQFSQLEVDYENLEGAAERYRIALQSNDEEIKANALRSLQEAQEEVVSGMNNYGANLNTVTITESNYVTVLKSLEEAYENTQIEANGNISQMENLISILESMGINTDIARQAIDKLRMSQFNQAKASIKAGNAEATAEKVTEDYIAGLDRATARVTSYGQAITKAFRTMSQLGMAINGLKSAWDTIKNPDVKDWEKVSSIIMSLGFAIPSLIAVLTSGFKGLTGLSGKITSFIMGTDSMTNHIAAQSAALAVNSVQLKSNSLEIIKNTGYQALFSNANNVHKSTINSVAQALFGQDVNLKQLNVDQMEGIIIGQVAGKTDKDQALAIQELATEEFWLGKSEDELVAKKRATIIAQMLGIRKTEEEIGKDYAAVASKHARTIATLGLIAVIAALVIGIGILIYKLSQQETAQEKANRQMKEAKQAVDDASEAYNNATNALNEYTSAIDEYKEKLAEVKKITESTTARSLEWAQALEESNASVRELIAKYPQLAEGLKVVNGALTLDENKIDDLEQVFKNWQNNTSAMKMATQIQFLQNEQVAKNFENAGAFDFSYLRKNSGERIYESDLDENGNLKEERNFWEKLGDKLASFGLRYAAVDSEGAILGGTSIHDAADKVSKGYEIKELNLNGQDISILQSSLKALGIDQLENRFDKNGKINEDFIEKLIDKIVKTNENLPLNEKFQIELDEQGQKILNDLLKENSKELNNLTQQVINNTAQEEGLTKTLIAFSGESNERYQKSEYKDYLAIAGAKNTENFITKKEEAIAQYGTIDAKTGLFNLDADKKSNFLSDYMSNYYGENWQSNYQAAFNSKGELEIVSILDEDDKKTVEASTAVIQALAARVASNLSVDEIIRSEAASKKLEENLSSLGLNSEQTREIGLGYAETGELTEDTIFTGGTIDLNSLTLEDINELKEKLKDAQNISAELRREIKTAIDNYDVDAAREYQTTKANDKGKNKMQSYIDAGKFKKADLDEFREYRDYLTETYDVLQDNAEAANNLALENMRLNHGVKDLVDNFEDYNKELKNVGSPEYSKSLKAIKDNIADITDIDISNISDEFATSASTLSLLEQVAKGSTSAIYDLQEAAAKQIVLSLNLPQEEKDSIGTLINSFVDELEVKDLDIGANLDSTGFDDTLYQMLLNLGVTAEDMQKIFNSLGWEPDIKWVDMPYSEAKKVTKTVFTQGDDGTYTAITSTADIKDEQIVSIPVLNSEKTIYKGSPKKTVSNASKTPKGSGGGSGKDKTPKKVKDEIDRYHEINEVLDDLSKKLDRINTEKDRAFGGKHLAAIDAEIAALEEEGKALDLKIAENKKYFKEDAARLNAYGAIYDEEGRVTNYNQIIENAVTAYNAGSIDDDQYSAIKDALSDYEDSLNTMEDLTEEKAENTRKILDAKFEKVEYTVEVNLKVTDFDNKILDWQLKQLDDRDFKSIERVGYYTQQAQNAEKNFYTNKQAIIDTLTAVGASAEQIERFLAGDVEALAGLDIPNQAIENLMEYQEGMMDNYNTIIDIKKAIEEELIKAQEEFNDKIEESLDLYDHWQKKIEFYKDLTDILGVKQLGLSAEAISRINASSINAQQKQIQSLKDQWELNNELLKKAQQERIDATTKEQQESWDKVIKETSEKMFEIEENIQDKGKDLLEAVQSDFEELIENIFSEFEDRMAGLYSSFEDMQEAFDQQKTLKEEFLPEYEKVYELNKLNRNLNKEMSKLNNVASQEKLRKLQEEINKLQANGVQMSKYDLEYLQKKYDLRLAEIAMEEARNNKNQVRLTRDTSGNYNYVYTNNEESAENAAQGYEDALYQAQKTSEDYITSTSGNILKIQQDHTEALKKLATDLNNNLITPEEYNRKVKQVNDYFVEQLKYSSGELDKALANNGLLYTQEYLTFAETRDLMKIKGEDFTKTFNETILGGIMSGYDNLSAYLDVYLQNLGTVDKNENTVLGKISSRAAATEEYINSILQLIAGTDMANFSENVKTELDKTDIEVAEVEKAIKSLEENGKTYLNLLVDDISTAQKTMSTPLSNMKTDITNVTNAFKAMIERMQEAEDKYNDLKTILDDPNAIRATPPQISGTDTNDTKSTDSPTETQQTNTQVTMYVGHIKFIGEGKDKKEAIENTKLKAYSYFKNDKRISQKDIDNCISATEKNVYLYYNKLKPGYILTNIIQPMNLYELIKKFDTGGYTGAWGSDGRLAMLHEKELVLNKQDTQNMLATVDLVRQLSNMIDLQKISRQIDSVRYNNSLSNYSNSLNNLQQEIHIDASFPGVTAREEIEQAFADLAVQATKYIHRY